FKFFGNRIQNHETALQQIGAPFHHPNLKSALTENFATRPFLSKQGSFILISGGQTITDTGCLPSRPVLVTRSPGSDLQEPSGCHAATSL
ncbi:hypothetical protein OS035_29290, partial [Rhizobium sp. 268]|uniref:hypothetical protein n=1 Tax=Rhizobium sp. 268 TaxID=2996375 RepID=UPI002F924229